MKKKKGTPKSRKPAKRSLKEKMPKYKIFNGKVYGLTAGTQNGTTKSHAQSVGENWKKKGYTTSFRVVKGHAGEYYTYSLPKNHTYPHPKRKRKK